MAFKDSKIILEQEKVLVDSGTQNEKGLLRNG